jgi:hypothetical protein
MPAYFSFVCWFSFMLCHSASLLHFHDQLLSCLLCNPVWYNIKQSPRASVFAMFYSNLKYYWHSILITRSHDRPGKTQQTRIFCGKALLLTSSGARVQESKPARSKRASQQMAKPHPFLRRIILHLGCITPWLAAAHRPSCHHGKGRTHGGKTAPACVQTMFTT